MPSNPHASHKLDHKPFRVPHDRKIKLADYDTRYSAGLKNKKAGLAALLEDKTALAEAQALLWANSERSVLVILQAMDAAGKDGAIKHVASGINPQGVSVHSFKAPNEEERLHHFLWRPTRYLPARGRIAIFNRSYYEEVLVVRVHPTFLEKQVLPTSVRDKPLKELWRQRYREINQWEEALVGNDVSVLKFFLNVSKEEQKERFAERLTNPEKHWKFSAADLREREYWDDYQEAFEDMLNHTSTKHAPWYVIPADRKWFARAAIADIIASHIEDLDLEPPTVSAEQRAELEKARAELGI